MHLRNFLILLRHFEILFYILRDARGCSAIVDFILLQILLLLIVVAASW